MAEGKKRMFTSYKVLLAVGIIVVAVAGLAISLARPPPSSPSTNPSSPIQLSYPRVIPWTTDVTTSANGTQILISYNLVVEKKIVFFDVELQNKTAQLKLRPPYTMPKYRNGEYLPMMILLTPSGRLVGAVRVCEPCASFLYYTDGASKLICDKCRGSWSLETLKVVEDTGCGEFPPYELPTTRSGDNIVIDISTLVKSPAPYSSTEEGSGCH